jgi:hypothetical protein
MDVVEVEVLVDVLVVIVVVPHVTLTRSEIATAYW